MKRLIFFFLGFFIFSLITIQVNAQTPRPKKTVVLPKNQVVNKDYFVAGDTVIVSGRINGDAYVAGGNVIIDGVITGDLLVAGGSVNISGTVENNVRAAGGNINIGGKIGKNLTVAGGNVDITSSTVLGNNLVATVGNITLSSPVNGAVNVAGGNVTLGSVVGRDVEAAVSHLVMTPQAKINGNLTYWSENPAEIQAGAVVSGQTSQKLLPHYVKNVEEPKMVENPVKAAAGAFAFFKLIALVSSLIIGLLFIRLLPIYSTSVVKRYVGEPWKSLGVGFLAVIAMPIAAIVLFVTVIGIPLAIATIFALMALCYISHLVVAMVTGQFVVNKLNKKMSWGWMFVIGMLCIFVIGLIPIIGKLILFFMGLMAIGALISNHLVTYNALREKKMV